MTEDFEHNRFLYNDNHGFMHFGCINPFCEHGSPALPHHWKIPLETQAIRIMKVSHNNRTITFEILLKKDVGKHKAGDYVKLTCADNFVACQSTFKDLFSGQETTTQ